ncbi:uncharacterized protein N7459_009611 [Penicillium hispanicum]|uniref:uncharacterized protein n=1 Tax=Penicillium hispanicum TaxID=1080232 RepID=UPI0025412374|nr:uncharacterized protein N7459_009611 [Penicillium hispanicum]KAJ5570181.1 hypothetical protein N7459_009611 [Penicillium hispanicum]
MAASRSSPSRPSIRLSPAHFRDNSRGASPERNPASLYPKIDPLLSNLSPESTLHALTSTEAVPSSESFSHDVLSQSISQVSPAERALGIRAAIAAQNLDFWYKEVQSWTWPSRNDAKTGKGFIPPLKSQFDVKSAGSNSPLPTGSNEVEHYGSLPAEVVHKYEKRIEEIRDGMDNLDVEELKEHVLNAHIPSRSRPSSSTSTVSVPPPLSYVQLSDFTAVVTATILRTLPYLSRLASLLTTWDVRLLVLRQIPGLLRELRSTRSALDSALHALRASDLTISAQDPLSNSYLCDEHVSLETAVVAVGRRMDRCLDALEGRQDTLPENWIDDLEGIESDFAAWVVEAERYKLRVEWLRAKEQSREEEPTNAVTEDKQPGRDQFKATEVLETSEPQLTELPVQRQHDNNPVATISKPESFQEMETIEEEPLSSLPHQTANSADNREVDSDGPVHSSTNSSSLSEPLPVISMSPCDLKAVISEPSKSDGADSRDRPDLELQSNVVVVDDLQTPTQAHYSPFQSFETPRQSSPTSVPVPATADLEDKENIPPPDSVPRQILSPPREPATKPPALTEHNIEEDPFIQKASVTSVLDQKEVPSIAVSGDESTEMTSQNSTKFLQPGLEVQTEAVDKTPEIVHEPEVSAQLLAQPENDVKTTYTTAPVPNEPRFQEPTAVPIESGTPTTETSRTGVLGRVTENPAPVCSFSVEPSPESTYLTPATSEIKPSETTSQPIVKQMTEQPTTSRMPLQSPIKLSKTRPAKLNLEKGAPNSHRRRSSTGSVGSLLSDNSSLISSSDAPGPHTGSSNEVRFSTPTRPEFSQGASIPSHSDHTLREDRLRRLENPKTSDQAPINPARSVSLPLERFINEKLELDLGADSPSVAPSFNSSMKPSVARQSHNTSASTQAPRLSNRPALTRGKSASDLKATAPLPKRLEDNAKAFGTNTARRAMMHQEQPKSFHLRKRLTAHPSLESLGVKRQELAYVEEDESELTDVGSRASSLNKQSRKPRDHLDEKINSILSTLPGRIHLVDPNNEAESSSSSSSLERKMRERFLSESPHGPASRSITPAPSLTIMPAARRRYSHAHKTEDGYVKLYHLHHGGQATPTKLFVRTVGEDGQRVMVRVGGGWADLGEYLREYVIHHGRRKVSETPRVEVQGLASRSSPGHPSPGNIITPAPLHTTSGRATPSRPSSVLSARPPSSLTVRKTRRGSNASDAIASRSVTTGALNSVTSPSYAVQSGRRRLSLSSSYSSLVDGQSPANASGHEAHSTPLGLAGPKPRSRHVSMSPEGEAWVEDVLQKTRRSSSLNPTPFPLTLPVPNDHEDVERHNIPDQEPHAQSLPKVRSVGDIGSIGTSRRVVLRGLGSHR